ncbi:MAG: hypothetical protein AB9846_05580 [Tenuifilaceae bacterium]
MKKIVFIILILFVFVEVSFSQYYFVGTEPFLTSWKQIKTAKNRIIFPAEAERLAIRYANLLSIIDSVSPLSLNAKQKHFDVVIHNKSVLSNGFVAWAPKRMEIITTQPSSTYSQPWLTQLALHETRHTSQLFKINGGIIKPISFLFGEQTIGAAAGLVPMWFFEGDAVAFETATSNTGRGRQAEFYQFYRTHYLTNSINYSYDKWLLGSYRDNIPNHYSLGYQLVSYANFKFGEDVWSNTLEFVAKYPFTIFPFYFGLRKETGLSRKKLFKETFNFLDSVWSSNLNNTINIESTSLVKNNRNFNDYRYPFLINDTLLVVYKENLSKIPSFVLVNTNTKKEKILLNPGYLTSNPSYHDGNVFWSEYKPHPRWEYLNYSVIKSYNIYNHKTHTISDNGKYFSPVYNSNNGFIYAISAGNDGSSYIVVFTDKGKKSLRTIELPEAYKPFELSISNTTNKLFVGVVSDKGKEILVYDGDGSFKSVYGPTYNNIHSISAGEDHLYFAMNEGFVENIFRFNTKENNLYRVTNSTFGSRDGSFSFSTNKVVFSNYTPKGYSISSIEFDTLADRVYLPERSDDVLSNNLSQLQKFNIDSITIPKKAFEIEKYRGARRFINIHSWAPFYYNPYQLTSGEILVKPGFTILSQNLTSTSVLVAGYGFDKSSLIHLNYQYFGLFPVVSYSFDLENNSPTLYTRRNTITPIIADTRKEGRLSVYLPLRLSANRFSTNFFPYVQLISSNDFLFSQSDSLYHSGLHRLNYRLYFSRLQRLSHQDIRSRLGFVLNIETENAPFNKNNIGSLVSGELSLYLPGIGSNHSLFMKFSNQNQKLERFYLPNKVVFPRGYTSSKSEDFKSISLNYLFPVAYPDVSLGSLVYLKRLSANTFYDYAENSFPAQTAGVIFTQKDYLKSYGVELYADIHLFRTRYPIRFKLLQGWMGDKQLPFNMFSVFVDFYGQ